VILAVGATNFLFINRKLLDQCATVDGKGVENSLFFGKFGLVPSTYLLGVGAIRDLMTVFHNNMLMVGPKLTVFASPRAQMPPCLTFHKQETYDEGG